MLMRYHIGLGVGHSYAHSASEAVGQHAADISLANDVKEQVQELNHDEAHSSQTVQDFSEQTVDTSRMNIGMTDLELSDASDTSESALSEEENLDLWDDVDGRSSFSESAEDEIYAQGEMYGF